MRDFSGNSTEYTKKQAPAKAGIGNETKADMAGAFSQGKGSGGKPASGPGDTKLGSAVSELNRQMGRK